MWHGRVYMCVTSYRFITPMIRYCSANENGDRSFSLSRKFLPTACALQAHLIYIYTYIYIDGYMSGSEVAGKEIASQQLEYM